MRLLFLLIFTIFSIQLTLAQTTVSGTVYVGKDPARFVNVVLEGTTFGALTAEDGKFSFSGVPEGDYTLLVNGLGFDTWSKDTAATFFKNTLR